MRRLLFICSVWTLFAWPHFVAAKTEPTIQEVQRQALRHAGLLRSDISRWRSGAKWSAALPQLRFTVTRDLQQNLKITQKDNVSISGGNVTIGPDEQDIFQDFDAGTRYQVAAVWYLDELVFNRDMILVSQERRRLQEERQELIDRVTKFYFERKAASERLKRQGLNRGERLKLETLILDRAARLDADTGGWFHAAMGS